MRHLHRRKAWGRICPDAKLALVDLWAVVVPRFPPLLAGPPRLYVRWVPMHRRVEDR